MATISEEGVHGLGLSIIYLTKKHFGKINLIDDNK
jgi:hypothetical protein